jgi:hypothetical protein
LAAPARGTSQPRKCQNPHCSRLVSPPARLCDICKKRNRHAARAGSARITRGGARRVLASTGFTAPASSPLVANADFYRERAKECPFCGLTPCPFNCANTLRITHHKSTGYGHDGAGVNNTEE